MPCDAFSVSLTNLEVLTAACRVLLKYLVGVLQISSCGTDSVQNEHCLRAIHALCVGSGHLSPAEQTLLADTMKGEAIPSHSNSAGT